MWPACTWEKLGAFSIKAHPPKITRHRRNPIRNWLETVGGARRGKCSKRNTGSHFFRVNEAESPRCRRGREERPRPFCVANSSVRGSPASLRGRNPRHRRLVGEAYGPVAILCAAASRGRIAARASRAVARRFGSFTSISRCPGCGRFTPNSGHDAAVPQTTRRARSRLGVLARSRYDLMAPACRAVP